ncbi:hypothetical protein DHEL01_v208725 [Diaporthe helianthi]|uniref:Uncharacterized protein n=1 Tax=Diaporthe helianthi TaxID=158607 RepID=A0A2P5HRJ9_DIAHE|nr:hypothetical protein DHEL01_v208725 [Diaporthe helianthi]
MIAVVSFVMLLRGLLRRLESCIAPATDYSDPSQPGENRWRDEQETLPLIHGPRTGSKRLPDARPGGKYGTLQAKYIKWRDENGIERTYEDFAGPVYDPLD